MLTFFQNALSQSDHTEKLGKEATSGDFEQRLDSLVNKVGQPRAASPEPEPEKSPADASSTLKPLSNMGTALVELSSIAEQLARVDLMIAQVIDGAPECEEAKHWQEVSLKALRWSRDMLCQKQMRYLAELGAVAHPDTAPSSDAAEAEALESGSEMPKWMGWSKAEVDACPEFVPQVASPGSLAKMKVAGGGSLRHDLELLRTRHPERVLIVRKIKKLGFGSPKLLEKHFIQYGEVSEVLVAHSHVKATSKRPNGRVRPAALGFVVMASADGVQCALEAGCAQAVQGTMIELSPFEAFEDLEANEDVEAGDWTGDTFQ